MTNNLNKKTNSKEIAIIPSKAKLPVRRGYWVSEYTKPVAFITEAEVYRLADGAKAMRDGERNYLMILTMFQAAPPKTKAKCTKLEG